MSTTIKKQRMEHTIIKQLKVLGIVLGNAKNAAKRDHHQDMYDLAEAHGIHYDVPEPYNHLVVQR